jgi:hypothetical protein
LKHPAGLTLDQHQSPIELPPMIDPGIFFNRLPYPASLVQPSYIDSAFREQASASSAERDSTTSNASSLSPASCSLDSAGSPVLSPRSSTKTVDDVSVDEMNHKMAAFFPRVKRDASLPQNLSLDMGRRRSLSLLGQRIAKKTEPIGNDVPNLDSLISKVGYFLFCFIIYG